MYRSTEIIQSFYQLNIPKEITQNILKIEREDMYKKSLYDWIYLSKECKKEKIRRFFNDDNHILFMRDIETIDGDAEKKYLMLEGITKEIFNVFNLQIINYDQPKYG